MKTILFTASANGLLTLVREGRGWREDDQALPGHHITCIAGQDHVVLAGTRQGIHRSADLGQTWRQANDGLSEQHVRWLAFHPDDAKLAFAGTEPADIFVSQDGGQSWQERPAVTRLRDDLGWDLPYSPEAGCVRGFAFHRRRVYAAVEQGGLLRSDDSGETWGLVEGSSGRPRTHIPPGFIHPDVHSVVVHPSSQDQVYAPTGGGFYYSTDGGQTWALLYRCYCRAVWVDPLRPGHIILGPADGVDRSGRIEESLDGGQSWQPAMWGLETRWPQHMVERFVQAEDDLVAVLSNGELIAAPLETLEWQSLLPAEQDVTGVAALQQP